MSKVKMYLFIIFECKIKMKHFNTYLNLFNSYNEYILNSFYRIKFFNNII